jgi:hypothetical protein
LPPLSNKNQPRLNRLGTNPESKKKLAIAVHGGRDEEERKEMPPIKHGKFSVS